MTGYHVLVGEFGSTKLVRQKGCIIGSMNKLDRSDTPLSDVEVEVLREGGVDLKKNLKGLDPLIQTQREFERYRAESLTPIEAATLLQTSEGNILKQIRSHQLYAIETEEQVPRLPRFQFYKGELLPGFETLAHAIPSDLHPIEVIEWFTEPNPDLFINDDIDQIVSPRDWLLRGENANLVALLLRRHV